MTDDDLPSESWYESGETTTQERLPDVRLGEQGQLVGDADSDDEPATRWEGYADYKSVSSRVAASIDDAVEAYALLNSQHRESSKVSGSLAAEARANILGAALKLLPEMREDRAAVDTYDEILTRWEDGPESSDIGGGYIDRLDEANLRAGCPGWLRQFVIDIRTAGWELGYLKAGRERETSGGDPVEEESDAMTVE